MQREPEPKTPSPANELARRLTEPAFLAAVCHDLRGPLGALGTWVNVLSSGRADAATGQHALAAMQRDVAAQRRLIEQLDDIASILGGTLQLSLEDVELAPLLRQLGAELQPNGSTPSVFADPRRLHQLLAILLGADAAGPAGQPPVLTASQEAPGGPLLIQGIVPNEKLRVVGLTLARALAEIQGGRLTTSAAARTTAFTVELPGRP